MRDIGKNIKELRQQKKMTQDELAEKLFVTRQTISNYETGKSRPDIEMLTRIAETFETDPNTVLYGIPQQANRERMILKLCISVVVLVVVWIGFGHMRDLAEDLAKWSYNQRLHIGCVFIGIPILAFLFGWTAMQALGVFAKLSPLKEPWCKRMRRIVMGTAMGYLLIIFPSFVSFVLYFDIPDILPAFISKAQYYLTMWLAGAFPVKALIKPNALLFGILGCALWLGIPQKNKQETRC